MARKAKLQEVKAINESVNEAPVQACEKDELVNLRRENAGLKSHHKLQLDSIMAELEASKAMYNESLNTHFQLRTQHILLHKQVQSLVAELEQFRKP